MCAARRRKPTDALFAEFLAAQKARLSPKTYARYESIIELYRAYLENYGSDGDGDDGDAPVKSGRVNVAAGVASGFSMFLDYFMPRKVMAGDDVMKAAGTVIKKLERWLVKEGHIEEDVNVRDSVRSSARDLPASQKLWEAFNAWLEGAADEADGDLIEGHFIIRRTEAKQIWLESMLGGPAEIGPIPVPAAIAKACKVGWDVGGAVARTKKGWRLVEVWNVSP